MVQSYGMRIGIDCSFIVASFEKFTENTVVDMKLHEMTSIL